jgi:hypothetical protein
LGDREPHLQVFHVEQDSVFWHIHSPLSSALEPIRFVVATSVASEMAKDFTIGIFG